MGSLNRFLGKREKETERGRVPAQLEDTGHWRKTLLRKEDRIRLELTQRIFLR